MIAGLIIWILFGITTAIVFDKKNREGCYGFILGLLLGPFGLIIALVSEKKSKNSPNLRSCPSCGYRVSYNAETCPECAHRFEVVKKENHVKECENCGERYPYKMNLCPECASEKYVLVEPLDGVREEHPEPPSEKKIKENNEMLTECEACGNYISKEADFCPNCGH